MSFYPEHPKRNQNQKFTPLSETTSIPTFFISVRIPPPPPTQNLGSRTLFNLRLVQAAAYPDRGVLGWAYPNCGLPWT